MSLSLPTQCPALIMITIKKITRFLSVVITHMYALNLKGKEETTNLWR